MISRFFVCALISLLPTLLFGRDLHVDPQQGNDSSDGVVAPVRTVARGLQLAQPGDTVHLKPGTYYETAAFGNRHGEPGKPIVLDGHGATLDGSEPIDPADWIEVSPGLFRNDRLLPRIDPGMIQRWYFLWSGRMNHMGRTSKGTRTAFKTPEELQPGEWTFIEQQSTKESGEKEFSGTFYVRIPEGQSLADADIRYPARGNGVQLGGKCSWLTIRNLTCTHVGNDGFNIHGDCHDVLFENIRAIECGDDGISAHETAKYDVRGFVSIGNSTGICDTVAARTTYTNIVIRDCLAYDLFFLDKGKYSLRNAVVFSSSEHPLVVSGRGNETDPCQLDMNNVWIVRTAKQPADAVVSTNAILTAQNCTFQNLGVIVSGGKATVQNCMIAGRPPVSLTIRRNGIWNGANNLYDLKQISFDGQTVTQADFAEFVRVQGVDHGSTWRAVEIRDGQFTHLPRNVGANPELLKLEGYKLVE